jgi:hypothetical protein
MVRPKGEPMPYLQIAIPMALILWLAFWPMRGRARILHVLMTLALVAAIILTFQWLWPSAYAPLALIALFILAALFGRRRPVPRHHQARIWPGLIAAAVALAATVAAAGLVTARLPPATTLDLSSPFATATAIIEGGAREVINRHRAVLDVNSPSLSSWKGMAYAVTLQPIDSWGKPSAEPQAVLAPCAGPVTTGEDTRLGTYIILTCAAETVVLSGLTTVTAEPAATAGAPLGAASSLTLHAQTPGTSAHPFSGDPLWITLNGSFPVRGWVIRP